MKKWFIFAGIVLLGVASVVVSERRKVDVPASPAALLYLVADTEQELTRMPVSFARMSDEEEIRIGNELARSYTSDHPRERHTSLFSATIPPEIATLVQWAMKNPETVEIGLRRTPAETVSHVIYAVAEGQKAQLLLALLEKLKCDSAIIFCRTKHGADHVANSLKRRNHSVAVLHSNRTQREREDALRGFRQGRFEALVATDIASRGLDIADVSHVINYDVPQHPEDYIHRIGRTGRAEHSGDALTLMVAGDAPHVYAD